MARHVSQIGFYESDESFRLTRKAYKNLPEFDPATILIDGTPVRIEASHTMTLCGPWSRVGIFLGIRRDSSDGHMSADLVVHKVEFLDP